MAKKIEKLTDVLPQRANANRHTARGMGLLEASIQKDGWIGAITVAADGETFDGSARIETGNASGFADVEPIIVRSRGDRPIIHIREDIPDADDPRAKRLGIAANRIGQINLEWESDVLAELAAEVDVDLGAYFLPDELALYSKPAADDWGGALGALPEGARAPFQQMTFTLSDEQAEQVRAALERARGIGSFVDTGNENSNGNALARVCEVFLGIG